MSDVPAAWLHLHHEHYWLYAIFKGLTLSDNRKKAKQEKNLMEYFIKYVTSFSDSNTNYFIKKIITIKFPLPITMNMQTHNKHRGSEGEIL